MKITVSYQTQELPAPYAYAIVMGLAYQKNLLSISFQIEYIGREGLSTEEVEAEGFSENDDFEWKGNLSINWYEDVKRLATMQLKDDPDDKVYFHIQNQDREGFPVEIDLADGIFQEIVQSILETSQRESPLFISIRDRDRTNLLQWSFATKTFLVNQREYPWEKGRKILQLIYAQEIELEAKRDHPAISMDSKEWYLLEEGVWGQIKLLVNFA